MSEVNQNQETSNATGENEQTHVPVKMINPLQEGLHNAADSRTIGTATYVAPNLSSNLAAQIDNQKKSDNKIFGFTYLQAGLGAVGIVGFIALAYYGIKHLNKPKA